ncbi:MAG: transposase [Candidatus Aminicenantes bacterium]|nr:transposase [Candidatus Aminicenantes bacterium]
MPKTMEVLRPKAAGLIYRAIARACLIGKETAREYLLRAEEAALGWPLPKGLTEEELERRLFPIEPVSVRKEAEPDWSRVHQELRKKAVTRHLW